MAYTPPATHGAPAHPVIVDHRVIRPVVPTPPVIHPTPPVVHPVAPPVHPIVPVHSAPPAHPTPSRPPASHHRHHDYAFVEGYGWWPHWFPYWEPYWYWYWQYLYNYYGGDANAEYAEYARDVALRELAPQWGWL